MNFFPTVAEERLMAVGAPVPWKSFSMLPRIGFFILSTICSIALFGFIAATIGNGKAGALIAGVMAIAAAEVLIGRFRFFAAGLEEALWFAGAIGIADSFTPVGARWQTWLTVFGIASLVAAIRLLNPFCAVLGAVLIPFRFESLAAPFCALVALVALALLPLPRRRPSTEHTIGALAVVMPLAAYLFAKDGKEDLFDPLVAGALLLYALGALIVGVRFRLHAPLLALFTTLGCFAFEVRELSGLSLEARLIVWGTVLLGVSIAVERYLKTPRRGITSRQLRDDKLGDLLQLAGTIAIAPHQKPPEQGGPQLESGGSSFGGAGAGGDF